MARSFAVRFFQVLVALCIVLASAGVSSPVWAAGVVSTCDEAHLLAAITSGGIVTFSCDGTIQFSSQVTVAAGSNLTIDGTGHQVVLDGGGLVRLFKLEPSDANLTLRNLTLSNGFASAADKLGGGAIYNDRGNVQINGVTFFDNLAYIPIGEAKGGAIYNDGGVLSIDNSVFNGNSVQGSLSEGGAIYTRGPMVVSSSTFSGNSANGPAGSGVGGAIFVAGAIIGNDTVSIADCTFSGNAARLAGGALFVATGGSIINSTFWGNFAYDPIRSMGGAIEDAGNNLTIANSTFWENYAYSAGGAIDIGDSLTLQNDIFADSLRGGNCAISDINPPYIDGGGNLKWNSHDLMDTSCPGTTGDPKLGPPGDYGGSLQTIKLLPGSAAINLAQANCPPTDERGQPRSRPVCDSGAYEVGQIYMPLSYQISLGR